jgi:hypothetical protein
MSKEGDKVERTFAVERMAPNPEGARHVLCEIKKNGAHSTYPYGWKTNEVPPGDLKRCVMLILDAK